MSNTEHPSPWAQLSAIGVNQGYASQIISGKRNPSLKLALRIFRETGLKFGPIKNATRQQISAIENGLDLAPRKRRRVA